MPSWVLDWGALAMFPIVFHIVPGTPCGSVAGASCNLTSIVFSKLSVLVAASLMIKGTSPASWRVPKAWLQHMLGEQGPSNSQIY